MKKVILIILSALYGYSYCNDIHTSPKDMAIQGIKLYEEGKILNALFLLEKAFNQKEYWTSSILSDIYIKDFGFTNKFHNKALEKLTIGVKNNCFISKYKLGKFFLKGKVVPKNINKAIRLLKESSKSQYVPAFRELAIYYYYQYNFDKAIDYMMKSADQNCPISQYQLAIWLLRDPMISQDISKAISLLIKSAKSSYIPALFELAIFYYYQQDLHTAINYMKQAADKECPISQYQLAIWLLKDPIIPQDIPEAINLLIKSAKNGYITSLFELANYYYVKKNFDKAINYTTKAANKGCPASQYQLAIWLLEGQIINKDIDKAVNLLIKSSKSGHISAINTLTNLIRNKIIL